MDTPSYEILVLVSEINTCTFDLDYLGSSSILDNGYSVLITIKRQINAN